MRLVPATLHSVSKHLWGLLIAGIAAIVVGLVVGTAPRAEDPPTTTPPPATASGSEAVQKPTSPNAASTAPPRAAQPSAKSSIENSLVNREVYVYKTIGRRDPFASLLEGEFETTVGHPLLDVSSMRLVGIVWGKSDKFALIEDGRGHGHILRVGDPVINGYVVGLTEDEVLVRQSSYGESQTVTIQLQRKESGSDAP
jgi:hypothetical protein